jgi:SAM-dependent methyltransferase
MPNETPVEFAAEETMARLTPLLAPGRRLLEVGCGRGALAARLVARGLAVTAIDIREEAIDEARRRGVPAEVADFLRYEGGPFDLILFTLSLHHIQPLPEAAARAVALLAPNGRVVVEDFAREAADRETAHFRYEREAELLTAGLLSHGHPTEERDPLSHSHPIEEGDPLSRWEHNHSHHPPLHQGWAIRAALAAHFEILREEETPYLYRYAIARLEESPRGAAAARRFLEEESAAIARGAIRAVGRWLVAARP